MPRKNSDLFIVDRGQLLGSVLDHLDRALILFEAPAGFGKSVLMQQVCEALEQRGQIAVYIQLRASHFGASELVLALSRAVHRSTGSGQETNSPFTITRPADAHTELNNLLQQIAAFDLSLYLLIDDAHQANPEALAEILRLMIDQRPPNLHLILATRERKSLPIAQLRLKQDVFEIGADDLRFTSTEIDQLFGGALEDSLNDRLIEKTEGWPAAIQLVRLSHSSDKTLRTRIESLSGSQRKIADYLSEEIIEQLPFDNRDFLVDTAHLDPVHGDLADYVRQRTDSWRILQDLHHSGIVRTGGDTPSEIGWFRLNRLMSEFLRYHQTFLGAAKIRDLNVRASDWLARNGDLMGAITHAQSVQEYNHAIDHICSAGGLRIGLKWGSNFLRELLNFLPISLIYQAPRIKLCWAFVLARDGRNDEANRLFDEVVTSADHSDEELANDLTIARALFRLYSDRPFSDKHRKQLQDVIEKTPEGHQLERGVLMNALCALQIQAGDLSDAHQLAQQAMGYYQDIGSNYLQYCMWVYFGILNFEEGRLHEAMSDYVESSDMANSLFPTHPALRDISDALQALVALEANDYDRAEQLTSNVLGGMDAWEGWSDIYLPAYSVCLEIAVRANGPTAAKHVLGQAHKLVRKRGLVRLQRLLHVRELDLYVRIAHKPGADVAHAWVESYVNDLKSDDLLRWSGRIGATLALARYEIHYGELTKAEALLENIESEVRSAGAQRYLIKIQILRTIVCTLQGRYQTAKNCFWEAAQVGWSHGYINSFTEESAKLSDTLGSLMRELGIQSFTPEEVETFAEIMARITNQGDVISASLFSAREQEVLNELVQGHPNKIIARNLKLSEPTIKFHLKHIYTKLGVNKRSLAISVAKQYSLHD